jgi:hypothetical protein
MRSAQSEKRNSCAWCFFGAKTDEVISKGSAANSIG